MDGDGRLVRPYRLVEVLRLPEPSEKNESVRVLVEPPEPGARHRSCVTRRLDLFVQAIEKIPGFAGPRIALLVAETGVWIGKQQGIEPRHFHRRGGSNLLEQLFHDSE